MYAYMHVTGGGEEKTIQAIKNLLLIFFVYLLVAYLGI